MGKYLVLGILSIFSIFQIGCSSYIAEPVDQYPAGDATNWDKILFFNQSRIIFKNDSIFLAYISTADTSITIIPINAHNKFINKPDWDIVNKIPIKNAFGFNIYKLPNSFVINNDTVVLFYSDAKEIVYMNTTGIVLKRAVVKTIDTNHIFSAGHFIQIDCHDNKYYFSVLYNDKKYPSYVAAYCDLVYAKDNDTLLFKEYSGKYPENYLNEYVHMNYFFRSFSGNSIIYAFQSSDSVFKYDLNGKLLKTGKINSSLGGKFEKFDTTKHGDIKYITDISMLWELNLFCIPSNEDSLIYIFKKLKRNSEKDPSQFAIICLDNNLNTKFEVKVTHDFSKDQILYFKDNYLYAGNLGSSKITKYKIHEK